ncbi:uncharacterized protein METZ01_LOCUS425250, partial [marine metagenome]
VDYSQEKSILKALGFFSLVLILPFPTGFYYLSRVIVFIGAIYAFTQFKNLKSNTDEPIYYLLIAVAFIYNPIMMVFLYERAIWIVVNICTALIFFNVASKFNGAALKKASSGHEEYVGDYKDGKCHGQGTWTFTNGDQHIGEYKDGKPHGQGTYKYANGDQYVGEFKDNKKHGQGTLTWAYGDQYIGEYKDGKKHGQGTYNYANGDQYVGEFKDDKKH